MRAREPAERGQLEARGFRIGYETFGDPCGRPLLLLPTWQIVHMRHWKMQVPFLARRGFHVVAYDAAGNGLAERAEDPRAFGYDTVVDQGIDLLDHLGIARADVLGFSRGCHYGLNMAARHPERVTRLVLIANGVDPTKTPTPEEREAARVRFWTPRDTYAGWDKQNAHYYREHWREWLEFFFGEFFTEPHSTKGFDDTVGWGLETTPEILSRTGYDPALLSAVPLDEQVRRVRCPVLVIHGTDDHIAPVDASRALVAVRPDIELVELEGSGHGPHVREPVRVNLEVERFLGARGARRWRRALGRTTKRALFVSSPIGLGHALRDVAIARELRALVPGLEIDWLAQHPVTAVLEQRGERVHPLSAHLAGESRHIESEMSGEHDLRVFRAWRNMDEILLANFMVFHDAVRDGDYDLWVGDEAWDVDHYLHENPELHTTPFAWLTDFVGWLPMPPDTDGREARLTADYNAEMIEHVERFPRIRDAALFVGNPEDLVPDRFGPTLPGIREWTEAHYDFPGYVEYVPSGLLERRAELRGRFGLRDGERVAVATVGGTAVGRGLLRRVIDAFPHAKRLVPDLRMIVVAGPRIDPASLPMHEGLEVRGFVPDLYELLAACDLALVQGGMSTCMELVSLRRPFLYFPLKGHFEQDRYVPLRLANYGVPDEARVAFDDAAPDRLAERIRAALERSVSYRSVEAGGARTAAERIATLV